jgi:hypothetical protein
MSNDCRFTYITMFLYCFSAEGKFSHVTPPETAALRAKANERQQESRKRKKAEKVKEKTVKDSSSEIVELESDDEVETVEMRAKKAKKAQKITAYIHIQTPAIQTKGRAKTAESKPVVKGPCFFTSEDDYENFKETLAKSIPCKLKLLPIMQMHWRYEKPANDSKKPLSSAAGFEALKDSLSDRKKDFVIFIIIPPPGKDDEVIYDLSVHVL